MRNIKRGKARLGYTWGNENRRKKRETDTRTTNWIRKALLIKAERAKVESRCHSRYRARVKKNGITWKRIFTPRRIDYLDVAIWSTFDSDICRIYVVSTVVSLKNGRNTTRKWLGYSLVSNLSEQIISLLPIMFNCIVYRVASRDTPEKQPVV